MNDVLLQMQITWDRNRLVAPEQFLPLLDRIAKNESYLHISRERAAAIAEAIRKSPQPPEKPRNEVRVVDLPADRLAAALGSAQNLSQEEQQQPATSAQRRRQQPRPNSSWRSRIISSSIPTRRAGPSWNARW